jgi:hypothetical protein
MKLQRITKERTCPVCKGSDAYRIRRSGISVRMMCRLLNLRPHYCPDCDTFFLGPRHAKEQRVEDRIESQINHHGGGQPQPGTLPH